MTLRLHSPLRTAVLLPGLLLAAGIALGGLALVLLAIVAAMIAVDRVLAHTVGFAGWHAVDADADYRRVTRGRRRKTEPLLYLPTDTGWAAVAPRRRLGVQAIEIASIVGSVDGPKALAFDRAFRPPSWSRVRWTQMCLAARRGTAMPPIAVYRVGGEHFVRDGHHRVSVARALGADAIEADVVELAR
jgi:hypothetical protein